VVSSRRINRRLTMPEEEATNTSGGRSENRWR
jgi:hypothetical protein